MAIQSRRNLCTTAEAARVLGVTMCRLRQLANAGDLWSEKVGDRARLYDRDQVEKRAEELAALRAGGHVRGPAPGGFKRDKPGKAKTKRKTQGKKTAG